MDTEIAALMIDLVETVGLLRRDLQQKKDYERYEGRILRVEQRLSALAERLSREDPELAKELRMARHYPARSLAFRQARHSRELKARQGPE